jgi:hypothetical protein
VTGPGPDANGQAARADLVAQWRAASARLYAAGTAAYDAANDILSAGVRPGMAQAVYDAAADLRDLARELALIERQRDNETTTGKDNPS